ncbi:hypothetical protein DEO72_LG7g695 [Vigna unguiculata]|uniref:Uncharacterized protein n=1 Tax=Vigna unguiculata TaxID=3917 RepID=A0A4D6MI50_VIGUN|nr:hypothetical protein DEO72_LG7g695 [Vigna unguiculata]
MTSRRSTRTSYGKIFFKNLRLLQTLSELERMCYLTLALDEGTSRQGSHVYICSETDNMILLGKRTTA